MSDSIKVNYNFNNTAVAVNLLEQMVVLIEDKDLGDIIQGIGFNRDQLTNKMIYGEIRLNNKSYDVLENKK